MEEARFLLVTVHYGTVLGWAFLVLITKLGTMSLGARVDLLALIAKLRYSVPTLVLLVPRKLPIYCNYEHGIFARFYLQ